MSKISLFLLAAGIFQSALAQSGLEKATVAYRKIEGHEILADVYRPKDAQSRPVIVYIHGGALIMGNRVLDSRSTMEYRRKHPDWPYFDFLAFAQEHGFAVVSIDYRLAPETKLPAIISDVEAAFRWIGGEGARQFHFDTDHLVVVGGSAGGYLALETGYRVTPRPKALVSMYGYGELNADWYAKPNPYPKYTLQMITKDEAMRQTDGTVVSDDRLRKGSGGKIYMYYRQQGLWPQAVSGFSPASLPREIAPYEPVKHVTREFPPTLMIHGTQDTDVPFEEDLKMAEQFKQHGVPYILRPIDKAEHGLTGGNPAQIRDAYHTMAEFMLKYLETP